MAVFYLLTMGISGYFFFRKKAQRKYIAFVFIGSVLAFCMRMTAVSERETQPISEILRETKSGEEKVVELQVITEREAEETGEKPAENTIEEAALHLKIGAQAYSKEELNVLEESMWAEVEKMLPGENESLNLVREKLYFPEKVEGYPFLLTWSSSVPKVLAQDGSLGEEIPNEGILVEVTACITEPWCDFKKERTFFVKVFPSQTWDAFIKRLENYLAETERITRKEKTYVLPEVFEGKRILFQKKTEDNSGSIFFLFIAGAVVMAVAGQKETEKKEKERKAMIEREYPQLAVRMAMLADTGMTISGAFKRIAGEYGRKKQEKKMPLYEEMLIACREMESGISEKNAYQNFGKRCQLSCVLRFTALLIQYTKSGAGGFKRALQEEAGQALKERKEYARRRGEEAGTKLLLPMMLMLVLVMVIIMIPAFTSFGM